MFNSIVHLQERKKHLSHPYNCKISAQADISIGYKGWAAVMELEERLVRRKIRPIECNAKCRYLKKTCRGTLRQVFYQSETPSPSMTAYCPLTHCTSIRVYSVLIHTGKGGGGELTREKVDEHGQ